MTNYDTFLKVLMFEFEFRHQVHHITRKVAFSTFFSETEGINREPPSDHDLPGTKEGAKFLEPTLQSRHIVSLERHVGEVKLRGNMNCGVSLLPLWIQSVQRETTRLEVEVICFPWFLEQIREHFLDTHFVGSGVEPTRFLKFGKLYLDDGLDKNCRNIPGRLLGHVLQAAVRER